MKKLIAVAALAVVPSAVCLAAEQPGDWSGEVELGYNKSTGNTESDNLLGRALIKKEFVKWNNELKLEAIQGSESGVSTKQSYLLELQANRDFTPRRYAFGNGRYQSDKFGGFRNQSSVSAGMGWHSIDRDHHRLNLEAGVGYRRSEEQNTGVESSEPVFVASAKWFYQLTETTELSDDFRVEGGGDNTFVENEIAARVKINSALGIKVSYLIRNNSDVPVGTDKTDTLTAVSLDYKF